MKLHPEEPNETIIQSVEHSRGTLPEMLTKAFTGALKAAMAEMERQQQTGVGRPFGAFGDITTQGCRFRVTIECEPPRTEPGVFDALRFL